MGRGLTPLQHKDIAEELSRLGRCMCRRADTTDDGLYFGGYNGHYPEGALRARFLAEGIFEEAPALRIPEDRLRWQEYVAATVAKARAILNDPEGDWHRAIWILHEAEQHERTLQGTELWLTARGVQLLADRGIRYAPRHTYGTP